MADTEPRPADVGRWRLTIIRHLEDFPRQYAALENAMSVFGDDFDVQRFKQAFDDHTDLDAYNRVQALERAIGRVQNYSAELAIAAVKLAAVPRSSDARGKLTAQQAFEALRDAKVINPTLCRKLVQAQNARTRIEHTYLQTPAGDVHRATTLVRDAAGGFIGTFRDWIAPYLLPRKANR